MAERCLSLGLELSTQSVKAILLDAGSGDTVYRSMHKYEDICPGYGTIDGVLPHADPLVRHTTPLMLLEAIEHAFLNMVACGIEMSMVKVVKLDAMQHCTVYLNNHFEETLQRLKESTNLVAALKPCLSRASSPIWEDRSTLLEVEHLNRQFLQGGGIARLTHNPAELRFPAAQFMKWAGECPEQYENTAHMLLLSAYLTSVLAGRLAAVDVGDGWGTNLNNRNLLHPGWDRRIVEVVERYAGIPGTLEKKLGRIAPFDHPVGTISPYFIDKYGMSAHAVVLTGTGDNPATLLGSGADRVFSLGSSYTLNGVLNNLDDFTGGNCNIFGFTSGRAMALTCFTNGGKIHEHFARLYTPRHDADRPLSEADWQHYIELAGGPQLRGDEPLLLPYLFAESVPRKKPGLLREGFDGGNARVNIRALHVSQVLSLACHAAHLGQSQSICVVGGGARNPLLRSLIASVFQKPVFSIRHADQAAVYGCALSGIRHLTGESYGALSKLIEKDSALDTPVPAGNVGVLASLKKRYLVLEQSAP